MGKRKHVHWSVLNDEVLRNFQAVAILEPYIYSDLEDNTATQGSHRNWNFFHPTTRNTESHIRHSFRAAIWISKDLQASQIPIDSHDMVAVLILGKPKNLLLIAAYDVGPSTAAGANESEFLRKIELTDSVIKATTSSPNGPQTQTGVMLCTDFNRHHPLWGGCTKTYGNSALNAAEPILDLALAHGLQSMLPAGTITWEHQSGKHESTIDVILASTEEDETKTRCRVHEHDHGSDHKPIEIMLEWDLKDPPAEEPKPDWKKADWASIERNVAQEVQESMKLPPPATPQDLDSWVERFQNNLAEAVKASVPKTRPSPYSKRWWTKELTILRRAMVDARNVVTKLKRRQSDFTAEHRSFILARDLYFSEMDKQKKLHWKEFIEDPDNVWKANQYAKAGSTPREIAYLTDVHGNKVKEDKEKAAMFMKTFFPKPPRPEETTATDQRRPIIATPRDFYGIELRKWQKQGVLEELPAITEHEITKAIHCANAKKAPGIDGIGFEVWKRLLPIVTQWIQRTFQCSIELGYLPKTWRVASIVVIRKPGKPDYTKSKAYRPISLLRTLSKALEAIVAARISFLAERHLLLPANHMGGRPKRSSEQAVNILREAISKAWKAKKVLSLVTFDVQGAFNGVHPEVLCRRLEQRHIPKTLVRWIYSFCTQRKASLTIGKYRSAVEAIEYAGIPQGSPLSPILYIFYNADLVESRIDSTQGSLGYIDDYTAWAVRQDTLETTQILQDTVIVKAQTWSKESGASFEAEKTGLIHFIAPRRKMDEDVSKSSLVFLDKEIFPQDKVKILGVILDTHLKMKDYIHMRVAKATKACLALARLQGLRPRQKRQLFTAVVAPIMDYVASAWFANGQPGSVGLLAKLERVQKLGAQKITGAFRSTSQIVAQGEAGLQPLHERLRQKVARHVIKLQTVPDDHPMGHWVRRTSSQSRTFSTPVSTAWRDHKGTFSSANLHKASSIELGTWSPWEKDIDIHITEDIDQALWAERRENSGEVIYTDASARNGLCGIGVAGQGLSLSRTIGRMDTCTVLSAELKAIQIGIQSSTRRAIWIKTDSQEALRTLQMAGRSTKAVEACHAALSALAEARAQGKNVRFRWIPAHYGIAGNEKADRLAKKATEQGKTPSNVPSEQVVEAKLIQRLVQSEISNQAKQQRRSPYGQYTFKLDGAFPGKHTKLLYDALSAEQAKILVQARTNHTHLQSFIAYRDNTQSRACRCGWSSETVEHVILACPEWNVQREALRQAVGSRWGDLSYMLGGYSSRKDWATGKQVDGDIAKWEPDIEAVKATIQLLQQTGRMVHAAQDNSTHERSQRMGNTLL